MSESKTVSIQFGSLASLLTVLFVGLKLTGYITWSWWWVLAPIWISWALVLAIVLIVLVVAFIAAALK